MIQKTISTPQGINIEYSKIQRIDLNDIIDRVELRVREWTSLALLDNAPFAVETPVADFEWIQTNYPTFFTKMVEMRDMLEEILISMPGSRWEGGIRVDNAGNPV